MIKKVQVVGSDTISSQHSITAEGSVLHVGGAFRFQGEDLVIPETSHKLEDVTKNTDVMVYLVRVKASKEVAVLVDELHSGLSYDFRSPTSLYTVIECLAWFTQTPGADFRTIEVTVVDIVKPPDPVPAPVAEVTTAPVAEAPAEGA
jgi:hypothetical protein